MQWFHYRKLFYIQYRVSMKCGWCRFGILISNNECWKAIRNKFPKKYDLIMSVKSEKQRENQIKLLLNSTEAQ